MTNGHPQTGPFLRLSHLPDTHSERVTYFTGLARVKFQDDRKLDGSLSRKTLREIQEQIKAKEVAAIHDGVDFSRIQIDQLMRPLPPGMYRDVETWGPYLTHFDTATGEIHEDNLSATDHIGLRLAATFRELLPGSRPVSLCDDYNGVEPYKKGELLSDHEEYGPSFSEQAKRNFRHSVAGTLKRHGALADDAVEGRDYFMLSEESNVAYAQQFVDLLDAEQSWIERNGDELTFVNEDAENPAYRNIHLRSKSGHWSCVALDAAAFLMPVNLSIVHLVVLPDYMKIQQDKVWELLRLIGIRPINYHNIFYDPSLPPEHIAEVIKAEFRKYR